MRKDIHQLIEETFKKYNAEPLAKQLLLDQKIKEAIDSLKESNRAELKRIETKKHIFWRLLAITSVALNFILLIASPVEIGRNVAEQVRENVVDPEVKDSLNKIVKDNSSDYVEAQLGPFKKSVDQLHEQLTGLKGTISEADGVSKRAEALTGILQEQTIAANNQVNGINAVLNVVALIVRSDHDDRPAFDVLMNLANDKTSQFQGIATEVVLSIATDTGIQFEYNPDWDAFGIKNPEQLSCDDCKKLFSSQIRADFKQGLLSYIWHNEKFAKYDRIDFLMSVIRDDRSIKTVRYAMGLSDDETKIRHNILDYKSYLAWWSANQNTYVTPNPVGLVPSTRAPN